VGVCWGGMLARLGARLLVVAILTAEARAAVAAPTPAEPPTDPGVDAPASPEEAAFPDADFGPRYTIEEVRVTGNRKTQTSLIVGELAVLGLEPGAAVDASDARVERARYRLLSLGYFLDVHLSVTRGSKRGAVVLVVNELFPATSGATLFWGGADVSETNFLGRGINLGAGFVASTKPVVPYAHQGLGLRLHLGVPPLGGPNGVGLSVTGLYNDGSEFYRVSGADSDPDPGRFVATRVQRAGGVVTAGKTFPYDLHASAALREEWVTATYPPATAATAPIDFMINDGSSRVGTIALGLDFDNRSDPVLPRSGMRAAVSVEVGSALFGSDYGYVKTVL